MTLGAPMDLQEALEGIGGWRHAVSCGNRQTWDKDSDGHWIRTPCSCGLDAARAALAASVPAVGPGEDPVLAVPSDDPMWGTARSVTLANTLARTSGTVTVGTWLLQDLVDVIDSLQRTVKHNPTYPPICSQCGIRKVNRSEDDQPKHWVCANGCPSNG